MEQINIKIKSRAGILFVKSKGARVILSSAADNFKALTIEFLKESKLQKSTHQLISIEELEVLKVALDNFLKEGNTKISIE